MCLYGVQSCTLSFFSSRRRHTRYWRDWSSDVCSSDLRDDLGHLKRVATEVEEVIGGADAAANKHFLPDRDQGRLGEDGRGWCREKGENSGVAGLFKKKKKKISVKWIIVYLDSHSAV